MEIKMSKVLGIQPILDKLKQEKMPLKLVYKFSKLYNAVAQEIDFYSTHLNEIIAKYAELDEAGAPVVIDNGTGVKIKKECINAAQKEMVDLLEIDVFLPDIKIKLDELNDVEFTLEDLLPLMDFIEE